MEAQDVRAECRAQIDCALGWGFDDPFTDQAISELVTTCVSATAAIIDAYQAAYTPARLGN